jgi:hypothetical protein
MLLRQITSERLLATPVAMAFDARNSSLFNILCANYFLAIFYTDFFRPRGANSRILKDLEAESGLFLLQIGPPTTVQLPTAGNCGIRDRGENRAHPKNQISTPSSPSFPSPKQNYFKPKSTAQLCRGPSLRNIV